MSDTSNYIGDYLGMPVIESILVEKGKIYVLGDRIMVNDMWETLMFPLLVMEVKEQINQDLMLLIKQTEERLFGEW